jgi:hypothetical protein
MREIQASDLRQEHEVAKRFFDRIVSPNIDAFEGVHTSVTALSIFNGDVFLAEKKPSGDLLIFLGDFTGHGLSAAIGAIPISSIFHGMVNKGFTLNRIATEMNKKLREILPTGNFLACAFAEINHKDNSLTFWNAGLHDILVVVKDKGLKRVVSSSLPLGIVPDIKLVIKPEVFMCNQVVHFFMYTDGVVEGSNAQGELFGDARLVHTVNSFLSRQKASWIQLIHDDLNAFATQSGFADDMSMVHVDMNAFLQGMELSHEHHIAEALVDEAGPWRLDFYFTPDIMRRINPVASMVDLILSLQPIYPYRRALYTLLEELYNNALEHGLLSLDSEMKSSGIDGFGLFLKERERRLEALKDGSILINVIHHPDADLSGGLIEFRVKDSGDGFDFHSWKDKLPGQQAFSGRGLVIVNELCETMEFKGCGNQVYAAFRWENVYKEEL